MQQYYENFQFIIHEIFNHKKIVINKSINYKKSYIIFHNTRKLSD